MLELNKVYCADCLELMKEIPDKSIALVLTDPPYNISRENNFGTMGRYNSYKGMDFGEWDWNFNQTGWLDIAIPKLKDNANMIIFNSWQNIGHIGKYLEQKGLSAKRPIVIKKTNPIPANRERLFLNSFEFGVWATKGKWIFNYYGKYNEAFWEVCNNGETEHPTEKSVIPIKDMINILSDRGG